VKHENKASVTFRAGGNDGHCARDLDESDENEDKRQDALHYY